MTTTTSVQDARFFAPAFLGLVPPPSTLRRKASMRSTTLPEPRGDDSAGAMIFCPLTFCSTSSRRADPRTAVREPRRRAGHHARRCRVRDHLNRVASAVRMASEATKLIALPMAVDSHAGPGDAARPVLMTGDTASSKPRLRMSANETRYARSYHAKPASLGSSTCQMVFIASLS